MQQVWYKVWLESDVKNVFPCVTIYCRTINKHGSFFLGLDSLEHSLFPWTSKILNFWSRSHTKLAGKQTAPGKFILNEKATHSKFSQESEFACTKDKAQQQNGLQRLIFILSGYPTFAEVCGQVSFSQLFYALTVKGRYPYSSP